MFLKIFIPFLNQPTGRDREARNREEIPSMRMNKRRKETVHADRRRKEGGRDPPRGQTATRRTCNPWIEAKPPICTRWGRFLDGEGLGLAARWLADVVWRRKARRTTETVRKSGWIYELAGDEGHGGGDFAAFKSRATETGHWLVIAGTAALIAPTIVRGQW